MNTECINCEHSHPLNEKRPSWKWMCMKHRVVEVDNFVNPDERMKEPYAYCKNVNYGLCPLFKEKELNQTKLDIEGK